MERAHENERPDLRRGPRTPGSERSAPVAHRAGDRERDPDGVDGDIIISGTSNDPRRLDRTAFLERLREVSRATAVEMLGARAQDCPYIEAWFARHAATDAATLERMARRYGSVAGATTAAELINAIRMRLRMGIAFWQSSEDITSELALSGFPATTEALQAHAGTGPAVLDDKTQAQQVAAELGDGHAMAGSSLPSPVRARAEHSFGQSLGDVRVVTGSVPGEPAAWGGARGRTVFLAPEVARTQGLSQLVLAHELAHVAQQKQGTRSTRDESAVEADADRGVASYMRGTKAQLTGAPVKLSRCMGPARPSGTMITPAHFVFKQIVPIRPGDLDPAGWQAAGVQATMSKDEGGVSLGSIECAFEVGVPLRNHEGMVSPATAAVWAAAAANQAAYEVLSSGEPPSQGTCYLFRREMEFLLGLQIPGARVGAIVSPGLTIRHFP